MLDNPALAKLVETDVHNYMIAKFKASAWQPVDAPHDGPVRRASERRTMGR
jgi:hypothetical protein